MTLQISTHLRTFTDDAADGWGQLLDTAVRLDALGVDRVVVSDHVVFGDHLDDYAKPELGGTAGGRQPTGPDGHWLEPLTVLSFVAARTTHVRLATGILLAALRRPVVLAKTLATLDVLSGGRVDLGVGVGWQRTEYDAAALDFTTRGDLLDHTLDVCQRLWTERVARLPVAGRDVFPVHMMPKPVQPGGVPVWVSGTVNDRVVRRLARFGSGWIPWGADAADPRSIGHLKHALTAAGVDSARVDGLQVTWTVRVERTAAGAIDVERTMEPVAALAEAGVTDVKVAIRSDDLDADELPSLVRAVHGQ